MSDTTSAGESGYSGPPSPGPAADLPTNCISRPLDGFVRRAGQLSAWLWLFTLAAILANVFSRFVLNRGSIALEELSWHFFGAAMMLSLGYAVVTDDHVRVDFLRGRFSRRTRAWIDLVLILALVLPVLFILLDSTISYAYRSFASMERSAAPSGLPYRFIIKSMLPLGVAVVMLGLVSRVLRCASLLFGVPRPIPPARAPARDSGDERPAHRGRAPRESAKIQPRR